MTPAELSAEAFKLGVLIGALAFVRWHLYEQYRVDAFRQRLFTLRAELFDYADGGAITFSDLAYVSLRDRMNRLIRFAHRYSVSDLVLAAATKSSSDAVSRVDKAIEEISDPESKSRLQWINFRVTLCFAWHLLCGSWFVLSIGLIGYAISRIGTHAKEMAERLVTNLPGLRRLEGHTHRLA